MTFTEAVRTCLVDKYFVISGRATRSEFWWFILFSIIAAIATTILDSRLFPNFGNGTGPFSWIYTLTIILPEITVQIRRLHDLDRSGWWYFICLIPFIGGIILLIWNLSEGTQSDNRFGPSAHNPKERTADEPPVDDIKPEQHVEERESNVPSVRRRKPTVRRK